MSQTKTHIMKFHIQITRHSNRIFPHRKMLSEPVVCLDEHNVELPDEAAAKRYEDSHPFWKTAPKGGYWSSWTKEDA